MVRIARRNTFGYEDAGGGVMLRRRVMAGTAVPDHYEVDAGDVEDVAALATPRRSHAVDPTPAGVRQTPPELEVAEPAEPAVKAAPVPRPPRRRGGRA